MRVGGIQSVTLGDEEARRRRTQKTVLERKAPPTFEMAVEMLERQRWVVHKSVADTVDSILLGHQPNPEVRTANENGQVTITREIPPVRKRMPSASNEPQNSPQQSKGWQSAGSVLSLPQTQSAAKDLGQRALERLLLKSLEEPEQFDDFGNNRSANGRDLPLHIYPYGISRHQLEQAIREQKLPVVLTF